MRDAGAVQEDEMLPRRVTLAGSVKGANVTTSTSLFTPCSPSVPAPLQLGMLNCSQGDRLVSLIFAQTLPSPSWQLIKLLEPSLESQHGRPVPGAPSGEMHFPGSLRMGRHKISHCCAWGRGLTASTGWHCCPAGMPRVPSSCSVHLIWLRRKEIQWAQDPHQGWSCCCSRTCPALPPAPHTPLQHQCSLCTWLQLC